MNTDAPLVLKGKVIRPAMLELGLPDAAICAQTQQFYETLLGTNVYPLPLLTNMALLCVVTGNGTTRTTVYWEIPGQTLDELTQAYNDLIEHHGCSGVHKPHKPPKMLAQKGDTYICTLVDASGNALGLVTNPPYPPLR